MKNSLARILALCMALTCIVAPQASAQTPIPGAIQAEDYDEGGQGVAYFDTTSGNTGGAYRNDDVDIEFSESAVNQHNVGWIEAGEWLRFTVDVTTSATVRVRYRVASQEAGPFSLSLSVDGDVVDTVTFNGTGGWQNWINVHSPQPFEITAGTRVVRLDFLSSLFNIDEFEFEIYEEEEEPLYLDPTAPVAARVDDLMARMTLDEKIGQMCQANVGAVSPATDVRDWFLGSVLSGGGENPSVNTPETWADMTDGFQALALQTRLQIPILYGVDAVHGHNNVVGATIFPHNIGMAATRNPDLMRQAAEVTAVEVAATGAHWTFAPAITVARNEWWGRFYEGLGELPEDVALMGAAAIEGYQGADLTAPTSILACAKHFAGDGGTLWGTGVGGGIDQGNTILDEATFRALHVEPYRAAIAAGARTIMASYSSWNGVKLHGDSYMLTDVLKGELGFEGFLLSDWGAVDQLDGNYANAVIMAINAGIDMVMVPSQYRNFLNTLRNAVQGGSISMERIDDAVRRILTVKFESGLFENPYAQRHLLPEVGSAAHREVARQAVAESLVVLKNDDILIPLSKELTRIHVAGKNADNLGHQCGGWTISWQGGSGATTIGTTILEAITDTVSPGTTVTYSLDGTGAAGADVGIVVVGETPYTEWYGDTQDLFLDAADLAAINNVRAAGIPVVVVLVSGRPMYVENEVDNWDAFVAAWLPGTEGQGVADVLFGDAFPFGILPFSWPRDNQTPVNVGDTGYDPLFAHGFSVYVDGDMDGDGLPDLWEARHGLDPYDDGSINPDYGADGDPDQDGGSNLFEYLTGTHPQRPESIFRIWSHSAGEEGGPPIEIVSHTVPGYHYAVDYADFVMGQPLNWVPFANAANGVGTWLETNTVESTYTFIDDYSPETSGGPPAEGVRYYRVRSTAP